MCHGIVKCIQAAGRKREPVDSNKTRKKTRRSIKRRLVLAQLREPNCDYTSPYNARYVAARLRDKELPIRRTLNNKAAILGADTP